MKLWELEIGKKWSSLIIMVVAFFCGLIDCSDTSFTQGVSADLVNDMVYIPEGPFVMGSTERELLIFYDLYGNRASYHQRILPRRWVVIKKGFYIDRYEVTNAQYQKFIRSTHREPPPHWEGDNYPEGQANFPVYNVTWYDANAYALWAGKRLPTEEEWEKAARGTDGRIYPWGNSFHHLKAHVWRKGRQGPREVGKQETDKSPYGIYDLAGNVMEWTSTIYEYEGYQQGRSTEAWQTGTVAVIKGGGWSSDAQEARADRKVVAPPDVRSNGVGFRCAR